MFSLLPSLRDLRVPVAAGYIWLLGLWIWLEPKAPDEDEASVVVASLYHLTDTLSLVGIGVVTSFVAYVVGALSTSLFSSAAIRLRPALGDRWPDPFSAQGHAALAEIARVNREELDSKLSMSETDVSKLLKQSGVHGNPAKTDANSEDPDDARPYDVKGRPEAMIAAAVTRELDTIASTRLLGRDDALFSLLDRTRSETEFRRGIAPPILFGGVVLCARIGLPWSPLVVLAALVLCGGLLIDSLKLERRGNDRLLDALADDRVTSPSLERVHARAKKIADSTAADDADEVARSVARGIRLAIKRLEKVGEHRLTHAETAHTDAATAKRTLEDMAPRLPLEAVTHAHHAVDDLVAASEEWMAVVLGEHSNGDGRAALERGKEHYHEFRAEAQSAIARMRMSDQAASVDPTTRTLGSAAPDTRTVS